MSSYHLNPLQTIQAQVVVSLGREYPKETKRLINCRPFSRCRSTICASCLQIAGHQRKDRLFAAVQLAPARRWKLVTLKSANVAVDRLRESATSLMKSARSLLKRLKCADFAATYETSFATWSDDAHPHIHLMVDTPRGGRNHVPDDSWNDAWLEELPEHLHPSSEATDLQLVEHVEAECFYINKSPFWRQSGILSDNEIDKTIAGIFATKHVRKFATSGTLKAA